MRLPSGFRIDDPSLALVRGLISYIGVTTANGNAGGTTVVCDGLALEPSYIYKAIKILTGPAAGQIREISTHPAGTNTVTVPLAFSNVAGAAQQITAGQQFIILSWPSYLAAIIDGKVDIIDTNVDTLVARTAREVLYKDQWCDPSAALPSLAFSNVAADKVFPNVVLPAAGTFLPAGAVIQSVYMMLKWRKQVDTSAALNAVNAANKTLRIKTAAQAWAAAMVAMTIVNGAWSTAASGVEGGDMIIGSVNVAATVNAFGTTYNIQSDQAVHGEGITVTGASLTLWDVFTGLRVYYTLG